MLSITWKLIIYEMIPGNRCTGSYRSMSKWGQGSRQLPCKVRRSTSAVLAVTWVHWLCQCPMVSCYSSTSTRTLETRRRSTLIPSPDCRSWVTLDLPEMRTAAACPCPTVIYLLIRRYTCGIILRIICPIYQSHDIQH